MDSCGDRLLTDPHRVLCIPPFGVRIYASPQRGLNPLHAHNTSRHFNHGSGKLLQAQDRIFREFPEVETVFGKVGRARTPTDPAPLSMVETTVTLKPENEWRKGMTWEEEDWVDEEATAHRGEDE